MASYSALEIAGETGQGVASPMPSAPKGASSSGQRRSQVGSGMRNEKIRTYNFPQSRVTDHRIGLTLYKIDSIMNGNLDELIDALVAANQAEKLRESGEAT